jgi:PAS domain S-box-containing protein
MSATPLNESQLQALNRELEGRVAARTGELQAVNQALRHSEERVRDILEAVLHGLVLVDRTGRVELVNRQLEAMFGYRREELVGASIEQLMPERYRARHGALITSFFAQPSRRDMAGRMELYGRRKDGGEFPVEIGLNPMDSDEGPRVLASITDVTARKAAREQLQGALEEKTALLNEVHHRVKNNLQVISSLLKMQARAAPPQLRQLLTESCSRVQAMSMIHQLLYEHGDLSKIQLASYLQQLVSLLRDTYSDRNRAILTAFHGSARDCHLDMQRAISCGLIVNELITNAFKHAFPEGRGGRIEVGLADTADGRIRLSVADDGVGLPVGLELGQGQSLGLRLLPSLVDQIGGEVVLRREQGTRYELTFAH